jgi:hypothetical protein
MIITAEFTRTLSIVTKIIKTTHYVSGSKPLPSSGKNNSS